MIPYVYDKYISFIDWRYIECDLVVNLSHFGVSIVVADFVGVGIMMVGQGVRVSGGGSAQWIAGRLGLGGRVSGSTGRRSVRIRSVVEGEHTPIAEYVGEPRIYATHLVSRRCYVCNRLYWTFRSKSVTVPCSQCGPAVELYRLYPVLKQCERCGTTSKRLCRHHRDRNKLNNSHENVEILCFTCHYREHIPERRAGYRRWVERNRVA